MARIAGLRIVHTMSNSIAIRLQAVSKSYVSGAGTFEAVRKVTLEVPAGAMVALVGKSGSGKSTLLNLVGGIDRPSAGEVVVEEVALSTLNEAALTAWRGRRVGFVFQFFQLLPALTAAENVMLPMDFVGTVPMERRRARALDLLGRFGVANHADKLPSALSGGEQQRVAIARALANDPRVILADEPTGNLDSVTARDVLALLRALADEGKTVLVVTHDPGVQAVADRSITLADGQVLADTARGA